jgi:hypothetical protein
LWQHLFKMYRNLVGGVRMTTIDLINWTVREAQHLDSERLDPGNIDSTIPSLDAFLAMIESEDAKDDGRPSAPTDGATTPESEIDGARRADEALPHNQVTDGIGTAETASPASKQALASAHAEEQSVRGFTTSVSLTSIQISRAPRESSAMQQPKLPDSPPVTRMARPTSPETENGTPEPALLIAIRQTDYRTAQGDRERAIALRWALRDILGKRLKLSPVSRDDLQTLISFGLIEMQNDSPTLTQAGLDVIS